MSVKKRILEVTIFLLVMFLTFYTLFSGKNLGEIANAVSKMSVGYLVPAAALAIFFVCAEGYMIWYLLQAMKANRRKEGSSLIRCIQYSFIGFFYSGITPSATGGQPVQLYYMSKDGNRGSDSTVVLMTVAIILVPASLFGVREIFPSLSFRTFIKCNFSCGHSGNYVDAEYYAAMCAFF